MTLAFVPLIPIEVLGQTSGRSLSGTVKSASGSPIPNVQVSVKNLSSGKSFSPVTGADGSYKIANLPPGNYDVFASAPGFASVRASVAINSGQDQVANLTWPTGNEQGAPFLIAGTLKIVYGLTLYRQFVSIPPP